MAPVFWKKKYFGEKCQSDKTHVLSFKASRCLVFLFEPSKLNDRSEFVDREKIDLSYVSQYFHLKGLSPTNIKAELDSIMSYHHFTPETKEQSKQ